MQSLVCQTPPDTFCVKRNVENIEAQISLVRRVHPAFQSVCFLLSISGHVNLWPRGHFLSQVF